jgi:hypothetical protein
VILRLVREFCASGSKYSMSSRSTTPYLKSESAALKYQKYVQYQCFFIDIEPDEYEPRIFLHHPSDDMFNNQNVSSHLCVVACVPPEPTVFISRQLEHTSAHNLKLYDGAFYSFAGTSPLRIFPVDAKQGRCFNGPQRRSLV